MAFQVLYRKWRPQRFSELVGQEHVSNTLRQAVRQDRAAHSYLFSGPRGTGKTSTARVLAKAVNCLSPADGDPCNDCARCISINESRFMDLIELDAASNRGIDEVRNIRDKVNLAPAEGARKVYIIDEAHMLTEHASNAFLKTLEEPPSHAIFVLCTTEPHKILPTIISRCQRFDFRRITSADIVGRLKIICLEEKVDVEEGALTVLAHMAGGSLRDAENLLEQVVVSYGQHIGATEVYDLLGLGHGERALELTRYLLSGNAPASLGAINRAAWDGIDLRQLHRQTVEMLRGALLIQCGAKDSLDLPQETIARLQELVPKIPTSKVMSALKLLGEVNMRLDTSSPLLLELAALDICMQPAAQTVPAQPGSEMPSPSISRTAETTPELRTRTVRSPSPPAPSSRQGEDKARVAEPRPDHSASRAQREDSADTVVPASADQVPPKEAGYDPPSPEVAAFPAQWSELVKALSRHKGRRFNIGALLRDCRSQHLEEETLVLGFAHRSHLERMQEELDDPQAMKVVTEALAKSLGASYQVKLTLLDDNGASNTSSTAQSPLVRAALSMGARIIEEREQ